MTSEAFAKAVTEMVQTLYRVSCSQLSVGADREDAVQETLRKAWEKRASLKDERYLHTWVIRILLNVCHDIRRERKRMIPTAESGCCRAGRDRPRGPAGLPAPAG